ncbi:unnamed protein product [Brassica rapa]|uniref:Small acidic protein 1 n=2 Tax=Brassica TaxID=3705 RepID=A0A3P6AXM4_BRACM|nr:unnamed protein product [Brassica napus]CAG7894551.1 unnamed protein product [Brassica rapa]CDY14885.1 BnaA02g22270D [Brassica napus]VDC90450.1 unnamed protein product [Brassica rapa]
MNRDLVREMMTTDIDVDELSTMPMDVDDIDSSLEMFGDVFTNQNQLQDANFFNGFEDDFDDSDIN